MSKRRPNDTRENLGTTVSAKSRPDTVKGSKRRSAFRGKDMTIATAKRAIILYRIIGLMSMALIIVTIFVGNMWLQDEKAGAYSNGHSKGIDDAAGQYRNTKLPTTNLSLIGTDTSSLSDYANEYGIPGVKQRVTLTNPRLMGIQQPLGQIRSSVAIINACYLKPVKPKPINYAVRIVMTTQDVTVSKPDWVVSSISLVGKECK